ncbi:hypothetical protein KEM60_00803 [Austwickia sp. TVS 96-490-7B]|uniref:hypothetical protein n=1 Tax=Austwickia sp. TVS 96-490-7B TaxID=2830843 RepID=UPI001C573554|nr:hypothetical protein [Austwickia sp. TVS 96-490-7B]MBW3084614.1 hypothetical protein [Austwickia sp. TVS 96-490-7B]
MIDEALPFTGIPLEQAADDRRVISIKGTVVLPGNRPVQGTAVTMAHYSGKYHRLLVSVYSAGGEREMGFCWTVY